jgi:Fe-S cluster biosynthesis and repair protein YggX
MNQPRLVQCKKLGKELPGMPFKPFPDELGQEIYDNVSMAAWQMWLQESPRYINTYRIDLQTKEGQAFLREQMKVYFGFEEGEMAETAFVPQDEEK